jgi:hypothetical protein
MAIDWIVARLKKSELNVKKQAGECLAVRKSGSPDRKDGKEEAKEE